MEKLKVKFNNGMGAILCSKCSKIIKIGYEFNPLEKSYMKGDIDYLPPQFCCAENTSFDKIILDEATNRYVIEDEIDAFIKGAEWGIEQLKNSKI
jgi:hypothetical protein